MSLLKINNGYASASHCVPSAVLWVNRFALFLIFFWFGFLKIIELSPAETLVTNLHNKTVAPYIGMETFLLLLGFTECIIGILWLIPKLTRFVIILFIFQMSTTFLPLIVIPEETWDNFLVLSLSGQYIFKNLVLIASAFTIYKDCQVRGWKSL